jgi:hypothetical protein
MRIVQHGIDGEKSRTFLCVSFRFVCCFSLDIAVDFIVFLLRIGRSYVQLPARKPALLIEDFIVFFFCVTLQTSSGIVPKIRPRKLHLQFIIHWSTFPFEACNPSSTNEYYAPCDTCMEDHCCHKWTALRLSLTKHVQRTLKNLWIKQQTNKKYEKIRSGLTLSLLMSYIYGAAANASKWQMGFNSAFKGLNA